MDSHSQMLSLFNDIGFRMFATGHISVNSVMLDLLLLMPYVVTPLHIKVIGRIGDAVPKYRCEARCSLLKGHFKAEN